MFVPNRSEVSFSLNQGIDVSGTNVQIFQFWYPGSSFYVFNPSMFKLTARLSVGTNITIDARLIDLLNASTIIAIFPTITVSGSTDFTSTTTTLEAPPLAAGTNLALIVTTSAPSPGSAKAKIMSFYMLSSP